MSERTVPVHVPRWDDANMLGRFEEGERRSEIWAALLDYKDRAMIESAAHMLRAASPGDDTDLPGLLAFLWDFMDEEDAAEFVEENRARIGERVAEMDSGGQT